MSKALFAGGQPSSMHLLNEVQTLRRRVAELEAALARAEQQAPDARSDGDEVVDLRPVQTAGSS